MVPGVPIEFTLYGPTDEVLASYSRAIITSRFLERAIDLSVAFQDGLEDPQTWKEILQGLDQLLVDFYGEQFTLDEIREGGDFREKMAVLNAILARAGQTFGPDQLPENPTPPGPKPRQTKRSRRKPGSGSSK